VRLSPRTRLAVAAALFLGWLGWLGWLAYARRLSRDEVLSRPQFLVSSLYLVADVKGGPDAPDPVVTVREVGGPAAAHGGPRPGSRLRLVGLARLGPGQGWDGPGEYVLPLTKKADGAYAVTPLPPTPGNPVDPDRLRAVENAAERLRRELKREPNDRQIAEALAKGWPHLSPREVADVLGNVRVYAATPGVLSQLRQIEGQ
jgi:hypothetical protein